MNILASIKQVPGTNKVTIDSITGTLKRDGTASKMNPYDLFALEADFQIAELCKGKPGIYSALYQTGAN